jgi:putative solute:sodium symporter small subunit
MTSDPENLAKPAPTIPAKQTAYWRRTRQLTVKLLAVWFVVTIATIFFARELSGFTFFGWPFSFYMAAQGATLVYLVIVGVYAWRMRQLERNFAKDHTNAK